MGLSHVVITSVDRDDLDDGGAGHFAETINAIRQASPTTTIEVLTPDFLRQAGRVESRRRRQARRVQPQSGNRARAVRRSSARRAVLRIAALAGKRRRSAIRKLFTKSGIMVGLGERKAEVAQVMDDLRAAEVDFLTIGQYLQPTPKHHAVARLHDARRVQGL